MFEFLSKQFVSVIAFIFVPVGEVAKVDADLVGRFAKAVTVKGTKQFHRFSPVSCHTLLVRELSTDVGGREMIACRK